MRSAVRSPPAAARVALELLETLRAAGGSLVAARSAVDRLRVLSVQQLAAERGSRDAAAAEMAIAALAADAAERLGDLEDARGPVEAAVAAAALAFALHRRVDALEVELSGHDAAGGGDESPSEWTDAWRSDCREMLADRTRAWTASDIDGGAGGAGAKAEARDGDEDARDALVELVERAADQLDAPALGKRLVDAPALRKRFADRVGVIPWRELAVDELGDRGRRVRRGQWLGTRVALVEVGVDGGEGAALSSGGFRAQVAQLFRLNHPHVLQVLGGCERCVPPCAVPSRVFVCEPTADGSLVELLAEKAARRQRSASVTSSRSAVCSLEEEEDDDSELEGEAETPRVVWRALLQVALALKFLHQRGIARGDVTCAQVLVGLDGAARLPAFAELLPRDAAWWRAPERLAAAGTDRATAESDVFSFGMCVVEAVERWQHLASQQQEEEEEEPEREADGRCRRGRELELPPREKDGRGMPKRPRRGFADDQWELVAALCCADPAQRMEMASAVHRIERFLRSDAAGSGLVLQAAASARPRAIAELLDELQTLVAVASSGDEDGRRMTEHVLHRLVDVHARLVAWAAAATPREPRKRSLFQVCGMAADSLEASPLERAEAAAQADSTLKQAVGSFRALLARFHAAVSRAASPLHYDADTDEMLVLMCASRTVGADEHYSFHVAVDQLVRRHLLAQDAAVAGVHAWKSEWNQQRRRQVERARRRLQTLLPRSPRLQPGEPAAACLEHGQAPPPSASGSSRQPGPTPSAPSVPSDAPGWFTPPHEVLFDPLQPFSEGSFGSAHLGSWLDTRVVVKKIKPRSCELAREADAAFRREIGIWHSLRHPHVVSLFGASCTCSERFFVCEFAARGELPAFLAAVGARHGEAARVAAAWRKLQQAALGLQYLHSRGVLHQDLKCDNVLVGSDGLAKLADFGLSAKLSDFGPSAKLRDLVRSAKLRGLVLKPTLRSVVLHGESLRAVKARPKVGAPRWKAPEVLAGGAPSVQSDVFSLGMCVVEAVSGRLPWGPTLPDAAVAFHVKRGALPPVDAARFSPGETALVLDMCRKDPGDRMPLESVVKALDAVARKHQAAARWA